MNDFVRLSSHDVYLLLFCRHVFLSHGGNVVGCLRALWLIQFTAIVQ